MGTLKKFCPGTAPGPGWLVNIKYFIISMYHSINVGFGQNVFISQISYNPEKSLQIHIITSILSAHVSLQPILIKHAK